MILENNNNNFNCSKPINGCFFFGPNIWYTSNIKERKNITLYNCWIISFYNATNRIKHRFICNRQNKKAPRFSAELSRTGAKVIKRMGNDIQQKRIYYPGAQHSADCSIALRTGQPAKVFKIGMAPLHPSTIRVILPFVFAILQG